MYPRFPHPSAAERDHPAGTGLTKLSLAKGETADFAAALNSADRGCCCLAKPVVMVVLGATASRRQPIDLLLCGHHYYVSKDALAVADATIYDSREVTIGPDQKAPDPVRAGE